MKEIRSGKDKSSNQINTCDDGYIFKNRCLNTVAAAVLSHFHTRVCVCGMNTNESVCV